MASKYVQHRFEWKLYEALEELIFCKLNIRTYIIETVNALNMGKYRALTFLDSSGGADGAVMAELKWRRCYYSAENVLFSKRAKAQPSGWPNAARVT